MANARRKRVTPVLETQACNLDTGMTYGQRHDLTLIINNISQKERKGNKKMTPQTAPTTMKVQRTVFDLAAFDDVKLLKEVPMPKKPEEINEALEILGSKEKLLEVIYKGLIAEARDAEWENIEGFKIVGDDGEPGELYTGKFADEEKGKLINAAILSIAKKQGYEKSLSKERKAELKATATQFLRSNPAMLQSIQG
jgi:hypothetical protein